jgi:RND family efflux transporter MFP subunit
LNTTVISNSLAEAKHKQESLVRDTEQAQGEFDKAKDKLEQLTNLAQEDARKLREDPKYTPLVSPVELKNAQTDFRITKSKLEGTTALMKAGASNVQTLQEQLRLHTLISPIAGRLGSIQAVPGQWLSVGTPVVDVLDIDDEIDVLCYVPPSLIDRLKVGQPAHSGPIDAESSDADGEIVFLADQAEPETGNFKVKVRLANKEAHLRANRVVRISVQTQPGRECLNLPEAAVQEDEEIPTVIVVTDEKKVKNADGKVDTLGVAHRMQVTLGMRDRKKRQVEILSLTDPEKEEGGKKKLQLSVKEAQFVVEGGQGVQTGDVLKLDTGDD